MSENASSPSRRRLILVLGDQLSRELAPFDGFDKRRDVVWMAEVTGESEYVWNSKQRIALFLSAMRHFRDELRQENIEVAYREIEAQTAAKTLGEALSLYLQDNDFEAVTMTEPGEHRLIDELKNAAQQAGHELKICQDRSFLCSRADFENHAQGRKQLRMEFFYREMRKRHDVLMDAGKPAGGDWNYDSKNRASFGKQGPETLPGRLHFEPDPTTREVIELVNREFEKHPGNLDTFVWPVTRKDALRALQHFIAEELPRFGKYQDAMWSGQPFLHHSLLASSLNLRLLYPLEVVQAAETAYRDGKAELPSVEGFIRQILGWREYVRGIYWLHMPDYLERNQLQAQEPLPSFYWTGDTDHACLKDAIQQTLKFGYAHHIQRLMVTGLYALLLGVKPQEVHAWYLAVYVDAVEWVELPNTLGMSQFGDGGVMASKPYVATGKYIKRMSNYCSSCRFNPDKRTGEDACPFTTLYWDFLSRHEKTLRQNPRMSMQLRNLDRIEQSELKEIQKHADAIRKQHRNATP